MDLLKMSSIVKCNSCNVVIDEMLSYIQNKLSMIDDESLIRICVSAFTSEEIKKSKTLLFESLPTEKRKILRKKDGKERRDLDDIISLFKCMDPNVIPVFVARQLEKLPPVTFDHLDVTKLLKDLTWLKSEVQDIQMKYATLEQLESLQRDISNIKYASLVSPNCNVNTKRGGYLLDSGPMGLSPTSNNDAIPSTNVDKVSSQVHQKHKDYSISRKSNIEGNSQCKPATASNESLSASTTSQTGTLNTAGKMTSPQLTDNGGADTVPITNDNGNSNIIEIDSSKSMNQQTFAAVMKNGEWKTVQRRKTKIKNRFIGKMGMAIEPEGNFRAADVKIPIFITNIHKGTSENDIVEYIKMKTRETVDLEKIAIKKQTDHNAYKFFVSKNKLDLYLDDKMWPQGVIFRRFVHFKHKDVNKINFENGRMNN